jgi:hypothetical protein
MAGVPGRNRFLGPSLFERCRFCVGPLRATVDLESRPASKTFVDPVFPIEPSADEGSGGIALPRPLINRIGLSRR